MNKQTKLRKTSRMLNGLDKEFRRINSRYPNKAAYRFKKKRRITLFKALIKQNDLRNINKNIWNNRR